MKAKIAIIGASGSAYKRTIPALVHSEICEVVAIQGRNRERCECIAEEFGIRQVFTDEQEMLRRAECDMVFIANPPFMHLNSVKAAAKLSLPVLCEKPLDANATRAEEYRAVLKGIPFAVAHHMRHQQAFTDLKELIASGAVGNVLGAFCQWGYALSPSAKNAGWKTNPQQGGEGAFSDNGIHVLDFIVGLFGKPDGVSGRSVRSAFETTYDTETMALHYGTATVVLNASQAMPYAGNHLLVYGSKGSIEAFGAFGEKSIPTLTVKNAEGMRTLQYPAVNLYGAEVEDFVRHFILKTDARFVGTSLDEALLELQLIDSARASF